MQPPWNTLEPTPNSPKKKNLKLHVSLPSFLHPLMHSSYSHWSTILLKFPWKTSGTSLKPFWSFSESPFAKPPKNPLDPPQYYLDPLFFPLKSFLYIIVVSSREFQNEPPCNEFHTLKWILKFLCNSAWKHNCLILNYPCPDPSIHSSKSQSNLPYESLVRLLIVRCILKSTAVFVACFAIKCTNT